MKAPKPLAVKGSLGGSTPATGASELRRKGRRLRLYFSNERLEKIEYISAFSEGQSRVLACGERNCDGDYRWCGYSRALAVVSLLIKVAGSDKPKIRGKRSKSAVSRFLDDYDNGKNPFNANALFIVNSI